MKLKVECIETCDDCPYTYNKGQGLSCWYYKKNLLEELGDKCGDIKPDWCDVRYIIVCEE